MAIIDTVPAVTDVSWREVWRRAEKTLAEAGPVPGWQANTVKALLNRLPRGKMLCTWESAEP